MNGGLSLGSSHELRTLYIDAFIGLHKWSPKGSSEIVALTVDRVASMRDSCLIGLAIEVQGYRAFC